MNITGDNLKFDNKVILVTGASDGIGKAVAIECAKHGATVILAGRTVHKLEAVYDEIKASSSVEAAIYPIDFTGATPDDYKNLADTLDEEFGRLDGLLNNAGWLGASTPIDHYDIELWYKVLQVNLNAPFLLTRACLPLLKKASSASIVFTADQKQEAYWGAYGVAKSGLMALMKIVADELQSMPICVNAIDPGPVNTNFRTRAYPAEDSGALRKPGDVCLPFLYLLNGNCGDNNGNIFTLDDFSY